MKAPLTNDYLFVLKAAINAAFIVSTFTDAIGKPRLLSAERTLSKPISERFFILLSAKEGRLELSAYDMELGMTTSIEAQVQEEGRLVLNARLFGDIVKRLPDTGVAVSSDEKNIATIDSGASEFSIIGIPAEEFPEFPEEIVPLDKDSIMS